MAKAAAASERATYRTVVLLRRSEKLKLERLASSRKLSSAEVIRRFIQDGEAFFDSRQEEEVVAAALKMISAAVAEANRSMTATMEKLDRLHVDLTERSGLAERKGA